MKLDLSLVGEMQQALAVATYANAAVEDVQRQQTNLKSALRRNKIISQGSEDFFFNSYFSSSSLWSLGAS